MSHVSPSPSGNLAFTVPFPVTYSVLSPASLLTEVLPLYNLGSPVNCHLLARGVNDTYLVQTCAEKYILRVYRTGWRTHADILYEIDVLLHLDRAGIAVSRPVPRADGGYICTLQAPEGPRQLVIFTYAPGRPLDRHDTNDSYYHGRALATIHDATETFTSSHTRAPLDLAYLIDQSLQTIQPLHACAESEWRYLRDLTERIRVQIQQFAVQGLDWGVCHGDGHMLNDHIDDEHNITFFDFDCCAAGWRAYDLAIIRWSEGFYHMDPGNTLWHAFLNGYTDQRPIAETDLAVIPAFVALREIWHTALIAWLQPGDGVQGFANILQRTLRLLREWEANLLYDPR